MPIFLGGCGASVGEPVSSSEIFTLLGLSVETSSPISCILKFSSRNFTCILPSLNSLVLSTSDKTLIVVGIPPTTVSYTHLRAHET